MMMIRAEAEAGAEAGQPPLAITHRIISAGAGEGGRRRR